MFSCSEYTVLSTVFQGSKCKFVLPLPYLILPLKNIALNIIIESKNTGETPYLQLLKKGGRKMKGDSFIRTLLIIIVTLLALNIILPILSSPVPSYAARPIQYKVSEMAGGAGDTEKILNEYGKEGWELITVGFSGIGNPIAIFKR
jgi:uncharacterized membrane protein YjgN (DUF898 family)